jgi:hypothetical protein
MSQPKHQAAAAAPPATATEEKQLDLAQLPEQIEREEEYDFQELLKRPALLRDLTLDTLSQLPQETVNNILISRARVVEQRRAVGLGMTRPMDWVLFRDREGNVVGLLAETGAAKVAQWLGISTYNHRTLDGKPIAGVPHLREIKADGGKTVYIAEGLCDVRDRERVIEGVPYFRRSDDEFTGRAGRKEDLLASWRTGIDCKAIGKFTGLRKVGGQELVDHNIDLALCRKGHGYGSSSERGAEKVAEKGVPEMAKALGDEILRRVGGEIDTARSVLIDITKRDADPAKPGDKGFKGFDSVAKFTKAWQVENAAKALSRHEVFGDQPQGE